jgi:hypothetical protein
MKYGFIFMLLISALRISAQPVVKVELSSDTISIGATVEITYTIENGQGQFVMPDMDSLPVISGPNSSSSFMYQDGKMSSSQSYSFTLLAMEKGKLIVPETVYTSGKDEMKIHAVEIVVLGKDEKPSSPGKNQETPQPTTTREKRKF